MPLKRQLFLHSCFETHLRKGGTHERPRPTGEAESVQQSKHECHHPRSALGESRSALPAVHDFRGNENYAQRDHCLDWRRRHPNETKRCQAERDAVRYGEGCYGLHQPPRASRDDHEKQMVKASRCRLVHCNLNPAALRNPSALFIPRLGLRAFNLASYPLYTGHLPLDTDVHYLSDSIMPPPMVPLICRDAAASRFLSHKKTLELWTRD